MKIINDISKVATASLMLYGSYNTANCSQGAEKDADYNIFRGGGFVNHHCFGYGYGFPDDFEDVAERHIQPISLKEGGNGLFVLNIECGRSSFTRISTAGLAFDTLEDALSLQKRLSSIYVKNFELTSEDFDKLCHCIEEQKEVLKSLSFAGIKMKAEQLERLIKALEGIQYPESFSMEFNNVSFTGPTIDSSIATLICHGFASLKVNNHNNDHRYAGTLQSALTEMVSKGTKIVGDLLLGTEFEIYAGERVCFWGSLKQTDLSWLDIIPNLMDTMPNLATLELSHCRTDFIAGLAKCLSELAKSEGTAIPLHVIINEMEQTGEIIEAAFQLPVSHLEITFSQAANRPISPDWFSCFKNEALKSIEICFSSDNSPDGFWDGLKDPNALKNLEQLKVRTRKNRDGYLNAKNLRAIIRAHNLVKLDIPNLCAKKATDKFRDWFSKTYVSMDEEEKAIEHKVITVILPDTEGTIDGGDFLQGTLAPEALPASQ